MKNPMSPDFQQAQGTTSLDLPPALASILSMGSQAPITTNMPQAGLSSSMMPQQGFIPSYQEGGLVTPTGAPQQMPSQMPAAQGVGVSPTAVSGPIDPQMLEMQINRFATQNPQQMQQIQQEIMAAFQTGELTPDELNMMVQLATVAAQNPQMYPNVRRFAIQQGIATEEDLPMEYDQGLVFVLLLAARAVQQMTGGQNMQQPIQSMKTGGKVSGADGAVLINAHAGEYVIPKEVVEKKGTEFFDKMIGKDSGNSKA